MERTLRITFYILAILVLLFTLAQFLGFNITEKIYNIKEEITSKEIATSFSCTELREENKQMFGRINILVFSTHLDKLCADECKKAYGLNYDELSVDSGECAEGTNLTCTCNNP